MLNEDIQLAQKIVSGSYCNLEANCYHNSSFIYKFTNERINDYQKYLENQKEILSITASGDQILNSILAGSKKITSIDISRFPQYFFELKKAAILSLTLKEYMDFFMREEKYDDILNDEVYDYIKNNLTDESREFWNSLFNFFDGAEICSSSLFSNEVIIPQTIVSRNRYLQEQQYHQLKNKIENVEINHIIGDIKEINSSFEQQYDLINLSSIFYYSFYGIDDYKKLLEHLPLNDSGIVITYLYKMRKNILNEFKSKEYSFETFKNSQEGIMVYQKVPLK